MAKYGMSMCVLGMAEEFKEDGIAVNALWPKFSVYTNITFIFVISYNYILLLHKKLTKIVRRQPLLNIPFKNLCAKKTFPATVLPP